MNERSRPTQSSALRESGVRETRLEYRTMELREIPEATVLGLHSLLPASEVASALSAGDLDLPIAAGEAKGGEPALLCLRPGEWFIFSETGDPASLRDRVAAVVAPEETALLDRSDGVDVFRLSGRGAPWLLSKLSGLDFPALASAEQYVARTRVGDVAAVIHFHAPDRGKAVFDLIVDRSFARYLWERLRDSADHADELAVNIGDEK